jgi:hypothetical protein
MPAHASSRMRKASAPHRNNWTRLLLLGAVCLLAGGPFFAQAVPSNMRVEWKNGLLTIHAENAPLSQIVQRVARLTGVSVSGLERLQGRASVNLSSQPLSEGLQILLPGWDYAYAPPDPSLGQRGELLIMVRGSKDAASSAAPVPVTADAADAVADKDGGWLDDNPEDDKKIADLGKAAKKGDTGALRDAVLNGDPEVQAAAFDLYKAIDSAGAFDALSSASQSDKSQVAMQSVALLLRSGADNAVILATLGLDTNNSNQNVRTYAIQSLPNYGSDSLSYLQQAFADGDRNARLAVLQAVMRFDWGLPLLQQATSDPDDQVRTLATQFLAEAQAHPGVEMALPAAADGQDQPAAQGADGQQPQGDTADDPFSDSDGDAPPNSPNQR